MEKLCQHPDYTHLQFGYPGGNLSRDNLYCNLFASYTENKPSHAFTVPHHDVMNLAFGWCAIVALGPFNAQLGGHFVLHDLKLIIPFPHGSCILIPSAFLWHSNVPIGKEDGHASLTFYMSGGLFCFIDNNFQTEQNLLASLDTYDHELHMIEKKNHAKMGALLYSTLDEILYPDYAELDPVLL
jgi:hypothetical protein